MHGGGQTTGDIKAIIGWDMKRKRQHFTSHHNGSRLHFLHQKESIVWLKRPVVGRQTTAEIGQTTEAHLSPPLSSRKCLIFRSGMKERQTASRATEREERGKEGFPQCHGLLATTTSRLPLQSASCRGDYTSFHAQSDAKFIKLGTSLIRQISAL